MLNKPSWWLPSADWSQWLQHHSTPEGNVLCRHPGCLRKADTVDHIVPRTSEIWGGEISKAHDPANLQPMCQHHNSAKGIRPDAYWNRNFYFDRPVSLPNLRASQSDYIYLPLYEYRDRLAGRFSQVNGKLNCFLQCTGAGKTIGKAMIPFALNHGALAHFDGTGHKPPRCDRMLIVPITTDLRDQIALELGGRPLHQCRTGQEPLRSQLVEFGIVETAPRVKAIAGFDQLVSAAYDDSHDIYVICSQSLWDSGEEADMRRSINDWVKAFQAFPVVVFDEFHRFTGKIREVVHRSSFSLCFGMSASPMTGLGQLLDDTTRITEYTFRDAARMDNSMKSLGEAVDKENPPLHPTFEDIITEMRTEETQQLDGSTQDGVGTGNFAPMRSVGWGVVERLKQTDNRRRDRALVAGFRHHLRSDAVKQVIADLDYFGHAVVGVRSIDEIISLQEHLNEEFDKDRARFPREEGWCASVTHSGRPRRGKVDAIPAVPLDENHPWLRAIKLRKQGAPAPFIDAECSRILIVRDKCKEGTNNPFCNVIGWGKPYDPEIGLIQRNGRGGRSFHVLDPDGTLHVPPKELDTIHLITHEVYGNGNQTFSERHAPLIRALQFFVDPHNWRSADGRSLNDIPTFRSWLDGEVGSEEVVLDESEEMVDGDDTARIVDYLAKLNRTGGPIREADLLKHCKAEHSQARRKRRIIRRAEELFSRDDDRISKVRRALGLDSTIEFGELMALSVLEKPDLTLEPVKAVAYMQNMSGGEKLEEMASALAVVKGTGYAEEVLTGYCVSNAPVYRGKSYFEREAPRLTNSSVLDRASEVASILTRRFPSQLAGRQGDLMRNAIKAIRMKLGLQGSQKLEKGGQFDVPAVFLELGEPRHMREIQGFVLQKVMTPDLERVLAFDEEHFAALINAAAERSSGNDDDF
jgi:hypothetical protein